MDFGIIATALKANGYSPRKADAKIAHDIVLKAIEDSGFHDQVTIKGGVVMSGITNAVRRATIDMDFDFLGYSLGDASVRRFVEKLNLVSECEINIDGAIQELQQQEYKGKRVCLVLTDDAGHSIKTKIDIGVHTNKTIKQVDFRFKAISNGADVVLLVNSKEQIFVEKLKSLLRLGAISTRYKDIYDLFYLCSRIDTKMLSEYIRTCIFEDAGMIENDIQDIEQRLGKIFSNKTFLKRMANPNYAWLDEPAESITKTLLEFFNKL